MRFVYFVHSAVSDWNHGNAHFIRGVASALVGLGHQVVLYEPRDAWSLRNLLADHGIDPVVEFARAYPELEVRSYDGALEGLDERLAYACAGADVVLVHEWNDPSLVNGVPAAARAAGALLLFHDTH